jgi:hypothetical protein
MPQLRLRRKVYGDSITSGEEEGSGMRFHYIALLLCIALVSCVSATPGTQPDLSGTWTVVVPSEQATGTAIIDGDSGKATITSTKLILPIAVTERFNIRPAGENRYLIVCTYGEYAVRYMSEEDYKESLTGDVGIIKPYAYRTIAPDIGAEPKPVIIDEV